MDTTLSFTLAEALILGFIYYLSWTEIIHFPVEMFATMQDPVFIGFIIGLMYGDVATGLMMGGSIGILYIATVAVGANAPSDKGLASVVAIALALKFNLPVATAIALAVPFGILGTFLDNFRRMFASYWHSRAAKHVEEGKYSLLKFDAVILPQLFFLVIRMIPVSALLYFAGSAAGSLLENMPVWLTNAFTVIGGMLPAVGIMLCVNFIGSTATIPFFVLGFYLCKLLGMPSLGCCLVGLAVALLYVNLAFKDDEEDEDEAVDNSAKGNVFTKGEIRRFSGRFMAFHRITQSMDYFYGTGTCFSMYPYLKKIYGNDSEGLKAACLRHLDPFITADDFGPWLLGASLAMEEDIAANGDPNGEKDKAIRGLKTSLMGPFAGIGDTIEPMTIWPIIKSIFYSFAIAGNPIALLGSVILSGEYTLMAYILGPIGYSAGKNQILRIVNSVKFKKFLTGASVLGVFMMGSMAAGQVSLSTPLTWTTDIMEMPIQGKIDGMLPGLLPFALCAVYYFLLKKGVKPVMLLVYTFIFGLIGSLIGIF